MKKSTFLETRKLHVMHFEEFLFIFQTPAFVTMLPPIKDGEVKIK